MHLEAFRQYHCPDWNDFPDIELYMDQVISVLERSLEPISWGDEKSITSAMINNYVKQKIIPPPQNKRYARSQLALLFMVCVWKKFMPLSEIALLLECLGKRGDEESYSLFARELTGAMGSLFREEEPKPAPLSDPIENAVRAACTAFAAVTYSRIKLEEAAGEILPPKEPEKKEEKKEKKEKSKEKQEKK